MLSRVWRYSWSSADRRCSNYIWVIDNFIAYLGASYIRCFTVHIFSYLYIYQYCRAWRLRFILQDQNEIHMRFLHLCFDVMFLPESNMNFKCTWPLRLFVTLKFAAFEMTAYWHRRPRKSIRAKSTSISLVCVKRPCCCCVISYWLCSRGVLIVNKMS